MGWWELGRVGLVYRGSSRSWDGARHIGGVRVRRTGRFVKGMPRLHWHPRRV